MADERRGTPRCGFAASGGAASPPSAPGQATLPDANELESVLLIRRFHRTVPGAVELLQHLLRRRAAGFDDALQRLEEAALVAAEMVDAAAPPQAGMRQHQALLGDLEQIAVLDPRLEPETRHVVAQRLALRRAPVPDDVPGAIEAGIVVEQPDPECRQ